MQPDIAAILSDILETYSLPWRGYHGIGHWARVLENGLRLAAETGAKIEIVSLFAVLHDSRRLNEDFDPEHGPRAAEYGRILQGHRFHLLEDDLARLLAACAGHTHERTHPDVTVQTCWDADRLDLGRVGITPDPHYLSTAPAKRPEILAWADDRAMRGVIPAFVANEWGINLDAIPIPRRQRRVRS